MKIAFVIACVSVPVETPCARHRITYTHALTRFSHFFARFVSVMRYFFTDNHMPLPLYTEGAYAYTEWRTDIKVKRGEGSVGVNQYYEQLFRKSMLKSTLYNTTSVYN